MRELLRPHLEECALEGVLERFSVACNLQRLLSGGFRFVIEAGEGGLAVKRDVFRRVASHFKKHGVPASTVVLCSAKVVLCSDTSILPIEEIASGMQAKYKARCIELRFFDPALQVALEQRAALEQAHADFVKLEQRLRASEEANAAKKRPPMNELLALADAASAARRAARCALPQPCPPRTLHPFASFRAKSLIWLAICTGA